MCNIDDMNQSINFPVLHENTDCSSENISDHENREGRELCDMDQFVSVSLDPGNVSGIIRNSENFDTFPDDELDYSVPNVNDTSEEAVIRANQQLNAERETRGDNINLSPVANIENCG